MSRLSRLIQKAGPIAAIAAPVLGGPATPWGMGATLLAGYAAAKQAPAAPAAPAAGFYGAPVSMAAAPALARLGGAMLGVARSLGGKIKGVWMMVAGGGQKFINRKKAVALAKRVGLDAAALALGISAVEMSEMILDDAAAPRRGKGITAKNIRTTKRVIGQVQRIHCQLGLKRGGMPRRACA